MPTQDGLLALCWPVDEQMRAIPQRPDATLDPREVVALALLCARTEEDTRAFYRWLSWDDQMGKKGKSPQRGLGGETRWCSVNHWGLILAWDCATATVHVTHVQPLLAQGAQPRIILTAGHGKQRRHGVWPECRARRAWTRAACNILAQGKLAVDEHDTGHLLITTGRL